LQSPGSAHRRFLVIESSDQSLPRLGDELTSAGGHEICHQADDCMP